MLKRFDVKFRIRIVSEELWREEGEEKEEKKERNSIHPTACFDVKYRNPQWVLIQHSLLLMAWMGLAGKLIVEMPTFDLWAQVQKFTGGIRIEGLFSRPAHAGWAM